MPAPPPGSEPAILSATGGTDLTSSECHSASMEHDHDREFSRFLSATARVVTEPAPLGLPWLRGSRTHFDVRQGVELLNERLQPGWRQRDSREPENAKSCNHDRFTRSTVVQLRCQTGNSV